VSADIVGNALNSTTTAIRYFQLTSNYSDLNKTSFGETKIMAKRNHSTWLNGPLQALTMGALLLSPVAHSQAISTSEKTTGSSVTQGQIQAMQSQIQMMQGQVQALVARVKSLEDQAQLASSPDDPKQGKSIEKRLESIEQEQAKLEDEESEHHEMKGKPDRQQGLTVVAPFTVVDGNNKIVMKVLGVAEDGHSRGIHAGNLDGKLVSYMGFGSQSKGGLFAAMRPDSKSPELALGIGPNGPKFDIYENGKQQFLLQAQSLAFYAANGGEKGADLIMGLGTKGPGIQMNEAGELKFSVQRDSLGFYGDGGSLRSRLQKESIAFYGDDGNSALSLLGAKNREKGFLQLSDSNGDAMVEAGVLDSHKGYVLASPYQASVDPHGDPSVLRGGKKK
jgi:TolA-binding protein